MIRTRSAPAAFALKLLSMGLFLLGFPPTLQAQMLDSYEGGSVRWQLVESDCNAQLIEHEISALSPHSGQTCELMEVAAGQGTSVFLAYPIEPCVVLNEFEPRIWARCASAGLRLGVRVVFPSFVNPVTGGRLTTIVWGEPYADPGNWQALKVAGLEKLMDAELIALRHRFGAGVSMNDAFIDSLVMNVYTGPGRYRLQVDDLSLRGLIALPAVGRSIPVSWRENWTWRPESINPDGRFWTTLNRPEVWLHYSRESLPWLRSLGITGLILASLPSEEQLRLIHDAKLSVVSPPPQFDIKFESANAQAIRGWLIGAALVGDQADQARQQLARIAQLPESLRRPVYGEALEQYWLFSRLADQVIVPSPDAMSAGTADERRAWLRTQLVTTIQYGSGIVSVNVGAQPQWISQYRTAQRLIEPHLYSDDQVQPPVPVDPIALRTQLVDGVTVGAKSIVLRSFEPLEAFTREGRVQAAALRWTINDFALWGPWLVAGQSIRPATLNRADYQASAWTLHNSHLVLARATDSLEQRLASLTSPQPLVCAIALAGNARQVFRTTHGAFERLETTDTVGGLQWQIAQPHELETFIITDNANVTSFVTRQLSQNRLSMAEDQLEVAGYQMEVASQLIEARFENVASQVARGQLALHRQAQLRLEEGLQALRVSNAVAASQAALDTLKLCQSIVDDGQRVALASLAAPQSSPFVLMPAALKYHWKLAQACERSQWRELPIAGANFESLETLFQSGWSQKRRLQDRADLRVEWVPASDALPRGLRLAAYQKQGESLPGGFEGASLRIRSAAAEVKTGQLVRIQAQANFLASANDPASGLLMYDNQAGPALGQLVRGQPGQRRPIELYRFAIADGEFRVLAECRGQCDVTLESISASVIEPATNMQAFPSSPIVSPTLNQVAP